MHQRRRERNRETRTREGTVGNVSYLYESMRWTLDDLPSLPPGAEEVSVRELRHDVNSERLAWGAVCDVVTSRTTLVRARVKLTDDITLAVLHVPHQSTRVSLLREDFDSLATGVIDSDLHGCDTNVVLSEGEETGISTDSKIRSIAVFADHHEVLILTVDVFGDCELVQRRPSLDPELPSLGELESGRTTICGIEHLFELLRGVLRT